MAFSKKTNIEKKEYIVKVLAARETKNDAIVMVDIDVNGVKIYSCILKELTVKEDGKKYKKGDKCYVLNLPQEKGSDGKYYDRVWFPRSNDMIDSVVEQVSEMLEG
jgi:hypothetical protein